MSQVSAEFIPTRIAILTVSERRGEEDDTSGHWLREAAHEAGHQIVDKAIVKENRYAIRAQVSQWIANDDVSGADHWRHRLYRRRPCAGSAAPAVRSRSGRLRRSVPHALV